MSRQRLYAVAAGLGFAILFPSGSTVAKIALTAMGPFVMCLMRFLLAGVVMVLIAHGIVRDRLPKGDEWKKIAVISRTQSGMTCLSS